MTVFGINVTRTAARPRLTERLAWVRPFSIDFGIVIGVMLVYFILRGMAPADEDFAMSVTRVLIDFEKATHTFWEPQIQEASIHFGVVKEAANFIYAYGHFPALGAVGIWLWFRNRDGFRHMRDTIFVSMVIGLVFYYSLPAAPPRLLAVHGDDLGFVDTIFGGDTAVNYAQPSIILNNYAAVPSFHFGWIALASAAVWVNTTNWWLRGVAVAMSVVMSWAIIASANHFWIDMALGGLVVLFAWFAATWIERYLDRRRAVREASAAAAGETTTRHPGDAPAIAARRPGDPVGRQRR